MTETEAALARLGCSEVELGEAAARLIEAIAWLNDHDLLLDAHHSPAVGDDEIAAWREIIDGAKR